MELSSRYGADVERVRHGDELAQVTLAGTPTNSFGGVSFTGLSAACAGAMRPRAITATAAAAITRYFFMISPIGWMENYLTTGAANSDSCEVAVKFELQIPVAPLSAGETETER